MVSGGDGCYITGADFCHEYEACGRPVCDDWEFEHEISNERINELIRTDKANDGTGVNEFIFVAVMENAAAMGKDDMSELR